VAISLYTLRPDRYSMGLMTSPEVYSGTLATEVQQGFDVQIQGYFDRTTRHSPQLDEIRNTFDIDLLYH